LFPEGCSNPNNEHHRAGKPVDLSKTGSNAHFLVGDEGLIPLLFLSAKDAARTDSLNQKPIAPRSVLRVKN